MGSWGWDGKELRPWLHLGSCGFLSGEGGVISPLWGLGFGLPCGDSFLSYLNSGNV